MQMCLPTLQVVGSRRAKAVLYQLTCLRRQGYTGAANKITGCIVSTEEAKSKKLIT